MRKKKGNGIGGPHKACDISNDNLMSSYSNPNPVLPNLSTTSVMDVFSAQVDKIKRRFLQETKSPSVF